MTCDEFEMHAGYSHWRQRTLWKIKAGDGDMKIEMAIDDMMQECIRDNFETISDTVSNELTECAECACDNGEITDEEKAIFLRILEKVRP